MTRRDCKVSMLLSTQPLNSGTDELSICVCPLIAGKAELGMSVILHPGIFLEAINKYGTAIRAHFVGNTIDLKDLLEHLVIGLECFLPIEEGSDECSSGIINGQMKVGFPVTEPMMMRCVELKLLSQVFAARSSRMV